MIPWAVTCVVAGGMNGVWFAGLMNCQPMPMKSSTIDTFKMTMIPLTNADSFVPRMSSIVRINKMKSAGTFMMP